MQPSALPRLFKAKIDAKLGIKCQFQSNFSADTKAGTLMTQTTLSGRAQSERRRFGQARRTEEELPCGGRDRRLRLTKLANPKDEKMKKVAPGSLASPVAGRIRRLNAKPY
jgi:hypothetical protein